MELIWSTVLKYENRYCTVKLNIDEDGNITEASD